MEPFDPIAYFRFLCIQPLIEVPRGEMHKIIVSLIGTSPIAPNGRHYRLGRATLLRWLAQYRQYGIAGLHAKARNDRGVTRKLDGETVQALLNLKKEKPRLTLTALTRQARLTGIIASGQHLPKATLYRLLKQHGLMDAPATVPIDRLRFEVEYPMDMAQADVMHGPKVKGRKAYLIAIIDDHSRLILWAEFRYQETVDEFIAVLVQAMRRRGLPRKLYVDNGSAFRSAKLGYALAGLGVSLLHTKPYEPQGKGKCERWFRTVRENFIPQLSLTDMESLDAINHALHAWIDDYYHQVVHSTTKQPPIERFIKNLHISRPAPEHLEAMFRNRCLRRVTKDRVVSLDGKAYQAPIGCAGKRLELRFDPARPGEVEAFDNGKSLGNLHQVMPHSNAKIRRASRDISIDPAGATARDAVVSGQVPFGTSAPLRNN